MYWKKVYVEPVQNLIYNSEFGRLFGALRQKPGYPLQSFLPLRGKKGFRGRGERPLQSIPIGKRPSSGAFPLLSLARTQGFSR
jgi:hypothetical protein